jgi:hypothetical protein
LLITTQEEAEANLIRRFYNVADLVVRQDAEGRPIEDFEPLIKTIVSSVRPTSWDEVGGPCPAPSPFTTDKMKVLVIAQLTEGHEEVEAVLANLRALRQESPKAVEGLPK